ncbi:hypothetical protein FB645_001515 [Coemansia sp. IMI 203386]|nr:hypothetical protein FB645_001515 [Coemansia sp. IMI 203386]
MSVIKTTLGQLLLLFCAIGVNIILVNAELFGRRGIDDTRFKDVRTAILAVDGVPTTCEIGLLSSTIGLFAVSCLVFDDKGFQDTDTKYEVYVYTGNGSEEPEKYEVDINEIFIIGIYEQITMYGNLAVLTFNKGSNDTYKAYSSSNTYLIEDSSYASHLLDFGSRKWSEAQTMQQLDDPRDQCSEYGRLYEANSNMFACNNATIESVYDSNCKMPYGLLYTMKGDSVVLVAIYTHSVILGFDECKSPRLNYYTYVNQFIPFASWIMETPIDVIEDDTTTTISVSTHPTIVINAGSPKGMITTTTYGANLYARYQSTEPSSSESTSNTESNSDDLSADTQSSSETDNSDLDADSDGSGMSRTAKIIVGVVVSLVGAAVIVGYFIYRCLKKKLNTNSWDPNAESLNVYAVGNSLNRDVEHIKPPPYSRELEVQTQPANGPPNLRVPETTDAIEEKE